MLRVIISLAHSSTGLSVCICLISIKVIKTVGAGVIIFFNSRIHVPK